LLPSISKSDIQIKLDFLKLEPLAFFLLFCRLKGPNVNRTNSAEFNQTLNKAILAARHVKTVTFKNTQVIESGLKKEANQKILSSASCAVHFLKVFFV
jgi:hypothetical protein